MTEATEKRRHFIRQQIEDDLTAGKHQTIVTRFPPEPNGYLHIGHAKSICLNFGLASEFQGSCYLRFDDTNPIKEEDEYVRAIMEDVCWLGFDWQDRLQHASDYFQKLFDYAVKLIQDGNAYIDSSSSEEIRNMRGSLQEPGTNSPYRERDIAESLSIFEGMKSGKYKEGDHVLRAKIDMSSGNINMRDPILYRILHVEHQRTGSDWCIYPMYDYAHPLSDAEEAITHSLCTLEFQDHRPLYDWIIEAAGCQNRPKQYEFARLNISHTITSKRKLREIVEEQHVNGWDDPRMPTLKGMRRRGYPAVAIRNFCEIIGISKNDSVIDMAILEECVRDELNQHAPRAMCVLDPLKIIIENFQDGPLTLQAANHPQNESLGKRDLNFSRELYIERDDFMENPSSKYFRLAPGKEVRLRNAYVIKCESVIKDDAGNVLELRCSYDKDTLGKKPEGRKVKGVIHWVSAQSAIDAEVRLYDRLFNVENPAADDDFTQSLNASSLSVLPNAKIEASLQQAFVHQAFQFERLGYFAVDEETTDDKLIFNRIVNLRDTWEKIK